MNVVRNAMRIHFGPHTGKRVTDMTEQEQHRLLDWLIVRQVGHRDMYIVLAEDSTLLGPAKLPEMLQILTERRQGPSPEPLPTEEFPSETLRKPPRWLRAKRLYNPSV